MLSILDLLNIIELSHFIAKYLKVFTVLSRDPKDFGNAVVQTSCQRIISAIISGRTPSVFRSPSSALCAINSSIELLFPHIF